MEGAGAKKERSGFTLRDALRFSLIIFVTAIFFIVLAWSILFLVNLILTGGLA